MNCLWLGKTYVHTWIWKPSCTGILKLPSLCHVYDDIYSPYWYFFPPKARKHHVRLFPVFHTSGNPGKKSFVQCCKVNYQPGVRNTPQRPIVLSWHRETQWEQEVGFLRTTEEKKKKMTQHWTEQSVQVLLIHLLDRTGHWQVLVKPTTV